MRFLCLHGMGTSGSIFATQTTAFRSQLDPQKYTFDFVDGPHPSGPAWGIEAFFPPPNFTFWQSIDPGDIAEAHRWVLALMAKQGPYDAVLCFSQGCAVISSLILHHNNEHPEQPLPFKAAVFICGGIPLAILDRMGLPVSPAAWEINNRTGRGLHEKAGAAGKEIEAMLRAGNTGGAARRGLWDRTDDLVHQVASSLDPEYDPHELPKQDPSNVFGLDFTRFPECLRINIPTVHIYGIKDPRYTSSIQLANFCVGDKRRVFDHGGGHDIPRTTRVSEQIAVAVSWLEKMIR